MGLSSAQWLVFRLEPVLSHTSLGHQRNAELHRALHPSHHQLAEIVLFATRNLEEQFVVHL